MGDYNAYYEASEDDEYRAFHGLPVKTYQQGPLQYARNERPTSAPFRGRTQGPDYAQPSHHPHGELAWQSQRGMERMQQTAALGYAENPREEYGTH